MPKIYSNKGHNNTHPKTFPNVNWYNLRHIMKKFQDLDFHFVNYQVFIHADVKILKLTIASFIQYYISSTFITEMHDKQN